MALSFDDRILGEKTDYYCSSSESEDEDGEKEVPRSSNLPKFVPESQARASGGRAESKNTGVKGVIEDWRRYKQLETEAREDQSKEKLALAKKLAITCRSEHDDEKEKARDAELAEEWDKFEEEFLSEYRKKQLEDMRRTLESLPQFGKLYSLETSDEFLKSIDRENSSVLVVVHVFEDGVPACETLNGCMNVLCQEYPSVKFCKVRASLVQLSRSFQKVGVPALLVYKNKELIGNFVGLGAEFGNDFFANDVESFLDEHGLLPSKEFYKHLSSIRTQHPEEDDSDFELD